MTRTVTVPPTRRLYSEGRCVLVGVARVPPVPDLAVSGEALTGWCCIGAGCQQTRLGTSDNSIWLYDHNRVNYLVNSPVILFDGLALAWFISSSAWFITSIRVQWRQKRESARGSQFLESTNTEIDPLALFFSSLSLSLSLNGWTGGRFGGFYN